MNPLKSSVKTSSFFYINDIILLVVSGPSASSLSLSLSPSFGVSEVLKRYVPRGKPPFHQVDHHVRILECLVDRVLILEVVGLQQNKTHR